MVKNFIIFEIDKFGKVESSSVDKDSRIQKNSWLN